MTFALGGSCSCGAIRYECRAAPIPAVLCHCPTCQKFHAAPYAACALMPADAIALLAGQPKRHNADGGTTSGDRHDAEGRSTVASDDGAATIPFGSSGGAVYAVWGRDDVARFPDHGAPPHTRGSFPPPGGCRASVQELPPGESTEFDEFVSASLAEFAEHDQPGMHRTASLDFNIVLEGTVGLELDGEEVLLNPGDIVVQNGTVPIDPWYRPGRERRAPGLTVSAVGRS